MLSQKASIEECNKHQVFEYEGSCDVFTVQPYFIKEENYNGNLVRYGRDFEFYNTVGSYFKLSFEKDVYIKNNFSLSFPIGLSYISQINEFKKIYWYEDPGMNFYTKNQYEINNKTINLSIGAAVNYDLGNVNIYAGMNCYLNVYQSSNVKHLYFNGLNTFNDNYITRGPGILTRLGGAYISSNFGLNYYLGKSISLGPSLEVFFASFTSPSVLFDSYRNTQSQYAQYMLGLNDKNIWINPGMKMQITF